MRNILVLCTGNSCRSVMAEALINQLGAGRYRAVSAGSKPAGSVHPKSIETLTRHGIQAGTPYSKSWDEFAGQHFDLVITVCDAAAAETCPVFFGKHDKLHWSTPDPAGVLRILLAEWPCILDLVSQYVLAAPDIDQKAFIAVKQIIQNISLEGLLKITLRIVAMVLCVLRLAAISVRACSICAFVSAAGRPRNRP